MAPSQLALAHWLHQPRWVLPATLLWLAGGACRGVRGGSQCVARRVRRLTGGRDESCRGWPGGPGRGTGRPVPPGAGGMGRLAGFGGRINRGGGPGRRRRRARGGAQGAARARAVTPPNTGSTCWSWAGTAMAACCTRGSAGSRRRPPRPARSPSSWLAPADRCTDKTGQRGEARVPPDLIPGARGPGRWVTARAHRAGLHAPRPDPGPRSRWPVAIPAPLAGWHSLRNECPETRFIRLAGLVRC
jgi:hypothetical protein